MLAAKWFAGARLNFADNLLEHDAVGTALIFCNERGERFELGWDELRAQAASVAACLRELGVGRGDRVAALIANRPEAIVAMLATDADRDFEPPVCPGGDGAEHAFRQSCRRTRSVDPV